MSKQKVSDEILQGIRELQHHDACSPAERLRLFEEATQRQRAREKSMSIKIDDDESSERDWTREQLYDAE